MHSGDLRDAGMAGGDLDSVAIAPGSAETGGGRTVRRRRDAH